MRDIELPGCFEPYLRYAVSHRFKNFRFADGSQFDDRDFWVFLLVEFKTPESQPAFVEALAGFAKDGGRFEIAFGPAVGRSRYATLRTRMAAVIEPATFPIWRTLVSRVELSLPVQPSAAMLKAPGQLERWDHKGPVAPLLIGILDDGCPFAAAQFRTSATTGAVRTRVVGIWDQNTGKPPVMVGARQFGQPLADFSYGLEYRRTVASPASEIGLDDWIDLHTTAADSIDEDGCYARAGFKSLARRQSHGGHVMDVFAGRLPPASRVGPASDRRDPPDWKPASDPAGSADVVFVQFSEDCIRDATGVWLKNFVLNGIQYILSFAHPTQTRHVVVNLSYGPTTGPHDGTALLESALAALVAEYDGSGGKPKLEIVLPAGNAYASDGHVAFFLSSPKQPDHVEWAWRLPPDNTVVSFAEIWINAAAAGQATVTLTSPAGVVFPLPGGPAQGLQAGVDGPLLRGNDTMWRLQVEPTGPAGLEAAEHGDWTVRVSGLAVGAELHAYVARSDPNMGVRSGARRSAFVDRNWQRTRAAAAGCNYQEGEFDQAGSLIHRDGTLNGIATGQVTGLHVAGGYVVATGRKSPYASAGPARGGARLGPDIALPCDDSSALGGIRAGGNRSGGVFRLRGTSAAAPQLARHLADPPLPAPTNVPQTPDEVGKRGAGNLTPP